MMTQIVTYTKYCTPTVYNNVVSQLKCALNLHLKLAKNANRAFNMVLFLFFDANVTP